MMAALYALMMIFGFYIAAKAILIRTYPRNSKEEWHCWFHIYAGLFWIFVVIYLIIILGGKGYV